MLRAQLPAAAAAAAAAPAAIAFPLALPLVTARLSPAGEDPLVSTGRGCGVGGGGVARRRLTRRAVRLRASSEATAQDVAAVQVPAGSRVTVRQGGDSLEVCRVLNGMWQTSGAWGRIQADAAVDAMMQHVAAGLTTFDMADHYGPAEDLYGLLLKRVRAEQGEDAARSIQGCTKWVPPPSPMTRAVVEANIERSRRRMGVDTLDMLQFHWWEYGDRRYLDALRHLTDLKNEGKIRTLALTNFDTKHLQIVLDDGIPIVSNQVQHSLVDMRPQQRMAELCGKSGVQLITYGTVLGGLLSEKYLGVGEPNSALGPRLTTPSQYKYKRMIDAWGGWGLFQELLVACDGVARKHGVTIPTVAVRYVLDQPGVAGSMVGVRLGLSEHIADTLRIFSLQLHKDDRYSLSAVMGNGRDLMRIIGDCGDEYRA